MALRWAHIGWNTYQFGLYKTGIVICARAVAASMFAPGWQGMGGSVWGLERVADDVGEVRVLTFGGRHWKRIVENGLTLRIARSMPAAEARRLKL